MNRFNDDTAAMQHALQIAERGLGQVEPNPAVGAVIADAAGNLIAEGYHRKFGEAHAEVNAIRAAGERTVGAQLFVTLEPCSHHGKTPPCADAVIAAGFRRVIVGCPDPAPHVAGRGIAKLQNAGIDVSVGICGDDARRLIAPFEMLMCHGRPWVHAKWAMTLDGRIATSTGHSQWISNEQSRAEVHRLRGCMDAILTGAGTVRADDPTLTARPPGHRTATRVILDSAGTSIARDSNLIRTIDQALVLVCTTNHAEPKTLQALTELGCDVFVTAPDAAGHPPITAVLEELGRRRFTNVLIEAGSGVLGSFIDEKLVDEVHVFVAPKLIGGVSSVAPVGGAGLARIPQLPNVRIVRAKCFDGDFYVRGDIIREPPVSRLPAAAGRT